jgi:hypothetical protein
LSVDKWKSQFNSKICETSKISETKIPQYHYDVGTIPLPSWAKIIPTLHLILRIFRQNLAFFSLTLVGSLLEEDTLSFSFYHHK